MAGEKTTDIEIAKRVAVISEWLLKGEKLSDILFNGHKLWNLSEAQVRNYVNRSKAIMKSRLNKDLEQELALHLERREIMLRGAFANNELKTALAIDQDSAKLKGLYVEKREDTVRVKVDLSHISTDELRSLIQTAGQSPIEATEEEPSLDAAADAEFDDIEEVGADEGGDEVGDGGGVIQEELL